MEDYFQACVQDLYADEKDPDNSDEDRCESLKVYAQLCEDKGVTPKWREATQCRTYQSFVKCIVKPPIRPYFAWWISCTVANISIVAMVCKAEHETFNSYASTCPATCAEPNPTCKATREACECEAGYVMDDGTCVHKSECGCVIEGEGQGMEYHKVGVMVGIYSQN